jgi:hypothetical protein
VSAPPTPPLAPNPAGNFYIAVPLKISKADYKKVFEENMALRKDCHELVTLVNQARHDLEDLQEQLDAANEEERYIVVNVPESSPFDLKSFNAYRIEMTDVQAYADGNPRNDFSRFILVTRRPYEDEFLWRSLRLYLSDEADIEGQTAKAWFLRFGRISFDGEQMPVILSLFTAADVQALLDIVTAAEAEMKTDDARNLYMQVMERMLVDMQATYKSADDAIETAEAFSENWREKNARLRKKIGYYMDELDTTSRGKVDAEHKILLEPWKIVLLSLGWVLFFILVAILWMIFFPPAEEVDPENPTNSTRTNSTVYTLGLSLRTWGALAKASFAGRGGV